MAWYNTRKDDSQRGLRDSIHRIVEEDKAMLRFTPDYPLLSQKKSHLVFIHDDMMQTLPNHRLIVEGSCSGFYPLCYGYTTKTYNFVKKSLSQASYPIAFDLKDVGHLPVYMANRHRIRGEIYAIRPFQMIALDNHRQNGVEFQRQKVNINVGYRRQYRTHYFNSLGNKIYNYHLGKDEMLAQPCWMYFGKEEFWSEQLRDGFFSFDKIPIIEEDRIWLKEYYQYNRVR